jgi:2,4-dienoyl-CoA reductase-like NADH-dependent reductase (Old Yellow Enzyme family)
MERQAQEKPGREGAASGASLMEFVPPWGTTGAGPPPPPGQPKDPKARKPLLFTPLTLRGVTLRNRVMVSPMCTYSSRDGLMNDWHLVHLGSFALGGAGLVMFEASAVTEDGRITPWDAGIWKDAHIPPLQRIVKFLHAHQSIAAIQIAHAGRKASTFPPHHIFAKPRIAMTDEQGGWTPVGPSPSAFNSETRVPHELSKQEIKEIITAFGQAATRAEKAGFDVLEIHGAHGYLISSFNSPLANHRTDEYGGDFEGRTKFCREVVKEVRAAWPASKPLFIRLSCTDWAEGGWDIQQTVRLAKILKSLGVDVIDCSSGGQSPQQKITFGPGFQIPFAERVKRECEGVGVCCVGLITAPQHAEEILVNGRADLVAIGRQMLRNPFWTIAAAKELGYRVYLPVQYEWTVGAKL